jgi:hypothetical protein
MGTGRRRRPIPAGTRSGLIPCCHRYRCRCRCSTRLRRWAQCTYRSIPGNSPQNTIQIRRCTAQIPKLRHHRCRGHCKGCRFRRGSPWNSQATRCTDYRRRCHRHGVPKCSCLGCCTSGTDLSSCGPNKAPCIPGNPGLPRNHWHSTDCMCKGQCHCGRCRRHHLHQS